MKQQTVLPERKRNGATLLASSALRRAAVHPIADHDETRSPGEFSAEPGFVHDFSQAPAYTAGPTQACPVFPIRCPFGGACHVCPTQMQAKRIAGQPGDARERKPEEVLPIVHEVLCSSGQPLDAATRAFMEPRFGHGFSQVRVHTDAQAGKSARAVNALAYTVGRDIVFGAGQYAPETTEGQRLLAHELTHVVQQGEGQAYAPLLMQLQPAPGPTPPVTGGLSEEMIRQIARRLREAMAGPGTDEEAIYSSFAGRTQEQVDAIYRVYQEMYGRALIDDLRDELTESEMRHLAVFSPTAAPGSAGSPAEQAEAQPPDIPAAEQAQRFADVVAAQLDKAMRGPGTDEESIFAALTGRTVAERQAIKDTYKRLTERELEADLRDEMSGSDLTQALRLLNQGFLESEEKLYLMTLDKTDAIEGRSDSDDKARAVVRLWRAGNPNFALSLRLKILLIGEMLLSFTGDVDERAILDLLRGSTDAEKQSILATVGQQELESNFHGREYAELCRLLKIGRTLPFVTLKRRNISLKGEDKYGHWWTEVNGSSYGWWPKYPLSSLWKTLTGVEGELNGTTSFPDGKSIPAGDAIDRDPHHGDPAEEEFHPKLKSATKDDSQVKDGIRSFAYSYSGEWRWTLGWGQNCRTFQESLMNKVGLEEP